VKMNNGPRFVAEYLVPAAWVVAFAAIFALPAFALRSFSSSAATKQVNAALEKAGDPRRAVARSSTWGADGKAALAGDRFDLKGGAGRAVVFAVESGGVAAPCIALTGKDGRIDAVLPWDANAARDLERLPEGTLRARLDRIEAAEVRNAQR